MKRVLKAVALITTLAVLAAAFCACDMVKVKDSPTRSGSEGDGLQGTSAPDEDVPSIEFTLSFDTDGGSEVPAITLSAGATLVPPEEPSREGYTFEGWFREDSTEPYSFKKMPKVNLTLTAHWTANSYTISFDSDGGSAVPEKEVEYGSEFSLPVSSRTGYEFVGWKTEDGVAITSAAGEGVSRWNIAAALQLYARWIPIDYTITYENLEGASHSNQDKYTIESEKITLSAPSSRTGYDFFGWYDAETEGTAVSKIPQGSTGNKTLYARWELIEYTITYENLEGASHSNPGGYTVAGSGITLTDPENREGYDFTGWFDSLSGGNKITEIPQGSTGNKTLYARWKPIEYTIAYENLEGASHSNQDKYTIESEKITLSAPSSRTGYDFFGWYDAETEGTAVSKIPQGSTGNKTLYARWELIEYTITYENLEGASHSNQAKYTIESEEITLSPPSSRIGYDFSGWFDSLSGGNKVTKIPQGGVEDRTLYAKWTPIEYTITYKDLHEATHSNPVKYTIETETTALQNPGPAAGYTFTGWKLPDGTAITEIKKGGTGNLEIHAAWTTIVYSITYENLGGVSNPNLTTYTCETETIVLADLSADPGYTFTGWYDSLSGGTRITEIPQGSTGDMTLYARWKPIEYTIAYENLEGAEHSNPANYTIESEEITLSAPSSRIGYDFSGWFDAVTGGAQVKEIPQGIIGDRILYARWIPIEYSITYENLQGAEHSNPVKYNIESAAMDLASPTERNGYTFTGWYDSESGGDMVTEIPQGSTGNKMLYARWSGIEYSITYENLQGASNSNPEKYTIETETTTLRNPGARTGHEFTGWFRAVSGGTAVTEIPRGSTGDMILYARWRIVDYTITYENLEGATHSNPGGYTVAGSGITLTDPENREGYTFTGWYDSLSGGNKITEIPQGSTGNKTLYARWEPIEYTITYENLEGAEHSNPANYTIESEEITLSAPSSRTGYDFSGWFDAETEGTAVSEIPQGSTGNKTLYARWEPIEYTIAYESLEGATHSNPANYTIESEEITLSAPSSRIGYDFSGWFDSETEGSTITEIAQGGTGDVTLYARWIPIEYSITYENLQGASNPNPEKYNIESAAMDLASPAERNGYTFTGWYDSESGGDMVTEIPQGSIGERTLYARWKTNKYTISFVTNLGTPVESVTLNYGDRLDLNDYVTTREGFSFTGWYLDVNDETPYEATTMPANDLTLNAKWVNYGLSNFKYNQAKKAIRETDTVSAALFDAVLIDTDGDEVAIAAEVNGTQTAGSTVQVRLTATGKYETKKQVTITDVRVYGTPTLAYDEEKKAFSLSDTVNAALWSASGTDTFGAATVITVRVSGENLRGGDTVDVSIESEDVAGNVTFATISGVKVYDKPLLTYDENRTAIKASDTIGSDLWHAGAKDNFEEPLEISVTVKDGTQTAGATITVRFSATDCMGNVRYADLAVRVYGAPVINAPGRTGLKVTEEITVSALGLIATDSHGGDVQNVEIELSSGTQTGGTSMVYAVTATDLVGNVSTDSVTVKIFDVPVLSRSKTCIKDTDDPAQLSTFGVSAKDSFGQSLAVSHSLKSGSQTSGTEPVYAFTATDAAGNTGTADFSYKVYSAEGITLEYSPGASNLIKLTSKGEEFGFSATDSFGEAITDLRVLAVSGEKKGGNTISLKLRATDALGNFRDSETISNIKVYDIPTAVCANDDLYIKAGQNIDYMFTVSDSFGEELYAEVESLSVTDEIHRIRVKATDAAGNLFNETYELAILPANGCYLALYVSDEKIGYRIVTQGENYILPNVTTISNYTCWKIGNELITDNTGASLAAWSGTAEYRRADASGDLIQYAVTYVLDGGTNDPANPSVYTIEDLGSVDGTIPLKDSTKNEYASKYLEDGTIEWSVTTYAFEGWYTEDTFTNKVTELSVTLGTVTLYAKWGDSSTSTVSDKNYLRINADGTPNDSGEYILFGEYPQTKVTDDATLSALGGYDPDTWTSYGYYIEGVSSDYMQYTDKEYDGARYRGVYFTSYRPTSCGNPSSADTTYQDDNGYNLSTVYWFKYEPIKWRILSEADGKALILCDMSIDSQQWDYGHPNYAESTIRAWLNDSFYNTAFGSLQKELIQTTLVDNSASNPFACENTNDKIFLLSSKEAKNAAYGFGTNAARKKKSTDYAQSQGCYQSSGNSNWWLRSPSVGPCEARRVSHDGGAVDAGASVVVCTEIGIVPALTISL